MLLAGMNTNGMLKQFEQRWQVLPLANAAWHTCLKPFYSLTFDAFMIIVMSSHQYWRVHSGLNLYSLKTFMIVIKLIHIESFERCCSSETSIFWSSVVHWYMY
jgi:hypothetical protein